MSQLVDAVIDRQLSDASCAGTHAFYAAVIAKRANNLVRMLSSSTEQRLEAWIARAVLLAEGAQMQSGAWGHEWMSAKPSGGPRASRGGDESLLATGHLAEVLLYLPENSGVSNAVLRRSGEWLLGRLKSASVAEIRRNFCPLTHAACAVRDMRAK
jgi:hypothetical protein